MAPGLRESLPIERASVAKENKVCRTPIAKNKLADKGRENAVTQQLVKTKMCAFFERGKCSTNMCRYAHSADELRIAPNLHKTKLCKAFLQGNCNDGEGCPFAHGEQYLRVTAGIYKTQMCNFFERGFCKKGDRCNHAHGAADLRPLASVAKKQEEPHVVDWISLQQATAPAFHTPVKVSQRGSQGRSPLPLAELLVTEQDNWEVKAGAPGLSAPPAAAMQSVPTPTKAVPMRSVAELASLAFSPLKVPTPTRNSSMRSVTELASLAFSPLGAHSPPWRLPGMMPLSPAAGFGAGSDLYEAAFGSGVSPCVDLSTMWPLDPVEMLVEQQDRSPYEEEEEEYEEDEEEELLGGASLPPPSSEEEAPDRDLTWPFTSARQPLSEAEGNSPGSSIQQKQQPAPPEDFVVAEDSSPADALSLRLANLDLLLKGLSADVSSITGRQRGAAAAAAAAVRVAGTSSQKHAPRILM